jgi:hypothetical protein
MRSFAKLHKNVSLLWHNFFSSEVPSRPMANPGELNGRDSRLEGWGEIAQYLKRSVRTAQIWRTRGLPVHRNATGVFAYTAELDEWVNRREVLPSETTTSVEPDATRKEAPDVEPNVSNAASRAKALFHRVEVRVLLALILLGLIPSWYLLRDRIPTPVPNPRPLARNYTPRLFARATAEGGRFTTIDMPEPFHHIIASPDTRRAYLAVDTTRKLAMLDAESLKIQSWESPVEIRSLAVSPDGTRLFVGAFTDGLVQLDARTGKPIDQIDTGGPVSDIAFSPDARRVYLAIVHRGVHRYSLDTKEWKQITTQGCPYRCTTDPQRTKLLVTYECGGAGGRDGHDATEIFDLATEKSLRILSGPPVAGGGSMFFPDGDRIWVNGGDACSRDIYDRKGCPETPSQIHHIYRSSDGVLLQSLPRPWGYAYGAIPPCLFSGGQRVLIGSGRDATVLENARFAALESYQLPPGMRAAETVFLDQERKVIFTFPTNRKLWVVDVDPDGCDDLGPAAVHRLSGDGTEHDSIENASLEPPSSYAPGIVGQAFQLDGQVQHSIRTSSHFLFGTANSTLSFYLKPSGNSAQWPLFEGDNGNSTESWQIKGGSAGVEFSFRPKTQPAVAVRSETVLPVGEWTHLAVTQTDRTLSLFINGVHIRTMDVPPGSLRHTGNLGRLYRLGWSRSMPTRYRGLIDEIVFWSRVLKPDEIRALYQKRREAPCKLS